MKCVNHKDRDAINVCNHCGKAICADCRVEGGGQNYCKECILLRGTQVKSGKRSPALAAILSFIISGLGQIYNGQVGKGLLIFFTGWLIVPWVIGIFDAYSTAQKINEGKAQITAKPGCVVASIVGIVVFLVAVFFLIVILAAIAIPSFLKARINANESMAKSILETISSASENYAIKNNGNYPADETSLTYADPAYLNQAYNNRTTAGYTFTEEFNSRGYKIIATPAECGVTGNKIFIMETGGKIDSKNCPKEE